VQSYGSTSLNGVSNLQPLVSVGIPTYNNPDGLRKVLDCITKQSYENLEIIVSINATPNHETNLECILVCKEFKDKDSRINWYFQLNNIGCERNFDFVRDKSSGKYFMWAQDDDWWSYKFIESLVTELEKNPEVPVACCPAVYISKGVKQNVRWLNKLSVYNAVGNGDMGLAVMGIWRRSELGKYEVKDYPEKMVLGIDHILAVHVIMACGKILVVNSERYVKGYTEGKFGTCFEYEPWYAFNSWWWMMKTLGQSPYISKEKKMLLPFIAITNIVRATGITGIQWVVSLPDNPVKSMVQKKFFGAN
jgi:hypothetical protein